MSGGGTEEQVSRRLKAPDLSGGMIDITELIPTGRNR